jgi:hypothetical protein
LPDSTLKAALQANLSEAATKLLQQLQPQEEQKKKPSKRAKSAAPAATQQKKKRKQSGGGAAVLVNPTLMDSSLDAAVDAILSGKAPKSYENVAVAPLISRFPPPEGLVEWQLLKSQPTAASGDDEEEENEDWSAEIDSAERALQICNALATQAPTSEHALAVFEPALAQMLKAVEALEAANNVAGVEKEELGANGSKHIASGWEQLKLLSNRAVMCMNLAAKEISVVNHADEDDQGAEADRNTRWWLSWNNNTSTNDDNGDNADNGSASNSERRLRREQSSGDDDVVNTARAVCSVAVSLCTVARLRTFERNGTLKVESLAAHAAHDMKILAPYAAIGQVMAAAEEAVLEEVNKTNDDSTLFLALYMAAVESSDNTNGEYYFLRMLAARNASAAATSLGDAVMAAGVLSSAAAAPPPPAALEWLRDQPPSSVVLQALESLQKGPQGLSAHLIYEAPERAVKALAAAAKAGGVLAATTPGGGAVDGEDGQEANPADDLLFFVSKEGDGGAFGRQDWGSDREGGSDDDEEGAGLVIDDLPDEGKSVSEEEYSEEDE